jgi:AraC-like DNA-binding protein
VVKQLIKESDINRAKTWTVSAVLDNDLLLTEHINEAPIPNEPRKMNFIIIGLCTKGRLKYQLDTQDQYINAGDMIIVSENRIIDKYESSSDFEGLVMMISINFFHEIIQTVRDVNSLFIFARSHPVISLENKEIEAFKEYFHVIQKRLGDKGNFFRRDLIRSLLLAMLYDVGNFIYRFKETDRPQTRAESFFTRFIKMVEEHCKHERRVGWYALQLGITPKYLSEAVKSVSKRTPNQWIDNYVLMEIRVMLKNSTKSVKEISNEMNFPNQSFMGRFFKEHMGMTPREYRRS